MNLIIVESPTKARTLGRFLGQEYVVEPTMGHVMDLPKSKMGVDIEHNFEPEYVLVTKKKDIVGKIKQEAKQASKIYLATDPDREGEAIAYHVKDVVSSSSKFKIQNSKFYRVVFHEITEGAVKHALENPRDVDLKLYHAQQARRVLDRLVGYKLSPLLWRKVRRGLSAGRVQSVTVKLIVEREREIEAFKSEEYWEIYCQVKSQKSKVKNEEFIVKLVKIDDKKAEVKNKEQADGVVSDLHKAEYIVSDIERKEVHKRAPAPFTTSTMAQAASRTYFWSAKKTMSVAQKLYEEGLITYHRTDSLNLSSEAVSSVRTFIEKKYGKEFLPEKPKFYKTSNKLAQEAHEAVRPTDVAKFSIFNFPACYRLAAKQLAGRQFSKELGSDAEKLYGLIWRRFVACQMTDSVFDETTIKVEAIKQDSSIANRYLLTATGQIMKFSGWRVVYGKLEVEEESVQLPEVEKDEVLQLVKVDPQQKFTQPPPRYTEASLIKTLEKLGIGRPSTYAPTISTIQTRQYVEKTEGKFSPTVLGIAVNDFLFKYFPNIVDYKFTARMEDDLDEIANGEKQWVPIISEFWKPFESKVESTEKTAKRVHVEVEKTGDKCPKCKVGEQVVRVGRFGKFLSCSSFPECDWTAPYIEELGIKCPDCSKGEVVARKTRKGKRFFGCSLYPKCKWASWRKPGNPEQPKSIA
ncbi:MAG: type I DNA topoisomerase [Candidatus Blackburnbacteria bacterium]|nr:type I DNA topoisomerase [Candidatus Blackburnbacteria bacterium]